MTKYSLGRTLDPRTPRAAAMYPVRSLTTTRLRRKWNQNGAWLDQGPFGTCVGNAFAHRRADGPLLIDGIDEAFAQQLYLEASAIFYGAPDTDMQSGTSALSACQALLKRGAIDKFEWMASPDDLRYTVLERGSVCVGTNWYFSMFDTPPDGLGHKYVRYRPESQYVGGHEYVINAIDLEPMDGSEPYYRMMAQGACLVCATTLMNPHRHESDSATPDTCPRCGTQRLLTPYPEPYCWACGRQFDWGQVVR